MIFLSPPFMSGKELEYIKDVFESNYIAPVGEFIERFEKKICEFTKCKYAVAVSSGTSAIHLALRVLGVEEGDYVLASTFTFIGSVSPIIYQNAHPIFIDSNYKTWNLDPELLEFAINDLNRKNIFPKALILTHLYGQPAEIDKILDICRKFNIYLIEDAAESLGATFNKKHTGTFGIAGIYSFNGNKIITTSGGGMLVSNEKWIVDKARFYATQAKENELWYEHRELGYNYRLSNVLAAIGVGQLEIIEEKIIKRRKNFELYRKFLSDLDVEFMPEIENAKGNRWLTTLIFKDKRINPFEIVKKMQAEKIETRPLWKPMHLQPVFKNFIFYSNGVSEDLFNRGICLPSGHELTENDIRFISEKLKSFLKKPWNFFTNSVKGKVQNFKIVGGMKWKKEFIQNTMKKYW